MKFPRPLRVFYSIIRAFFFFGLGVGICALYPEAPKKLRDMTFPKPPLPAPSPAQINEILSGSMALVEAQHTYYVHVSRNTKFAANIGELGSRNDEGGTVMVLSVWNASDAVPSPNPIHGYLFKILPLGTGPDSKDGFIVAAYPSDSQADQWKWPVLLSVVPDAKGGIIGMSSRDTWEIVDTTAATEIRDMLQRGKVTLEELGKFSPENFPASSLIENFRMEIR